METTNTLTVIAHRRQLILSGNNETAKALLYNSRISAFMVDVDHFKSINDTWRDPRGDHVIQFLANSKALQRKRVHLTVRVRHIDCFVILSRRLMYFSYKQGIIENCKKN